ncbi:MAG: formate dehydrogenase accessory sulfurtransferase FdhD [Polyangiaceae bacterium]|nr:formate dehydrogenase accessory sulfurtransferase FdhD [Myxococcales bacterium]MCB9589957.1 formate dehydrogenase accessory sulfurtransferase FdhD [Polyangiaceae bacterium]
MAERFTPHPRFAGLVETDIVRRRDGANEATRDFISVEEPLSISVDGDVLATTMRTPGQDRELALGLLFAESVVSCRGDIGSLTHCGKPGDEGYGNLIEARGAPGVRLDIEDGSPARRGTLATSACGVCGRRTVDDLMARCTPVPPVEFRSPAIASAVAALTAGQQQHRLSGGLHAAGAADVSGDLQIAFEDVGRHNAVDKLVGHLLLKSADDELLPARGMLLVVSGRTSFEIVQKAARAGFAAVAGVSAPSSLAIQTAERASILLCGFVREGRLNAYTFAERLLP